MKTIEVENLTKSFGEFTAVNNISFDVNPGEIFGFLGANGAGKTTAIRMLCGLLQPTSGKARVAGYDVYKQIKEVKQNIGYMSQRFTLYEDLTVKENINFYASIYGLSRSEIKIRTQKLFDRLEMNMGQDHLIKALPLGWRQRISFMLAIIHRPAVVFLDEPTGGVDPLIRRQFWEMIYETAHSGITVFVTTHYMDEAEYCDRVSIMVDGSIQALDTPRKLKKSFNAKNMDEVFYALARGTSSI